MATNESNNYRSTTTYAFHIELKVLNKYSYNGFLELTSYICTSSSYFFFLITDKTMSTFTFILTSSLQQFHSRFQNIRLLGIYLVCILTVRSSSLMTLLVIVRRTSFFFCINLRMYKSFEILKTGVTTFVYNELFFKIPSR